MPSVAAVGRYSASPACSPGEEGREKAAVQRGAGCGSPAQDATKEVALFAKHLIARHACQARYAWMSLQVAGHAGGATLLQNTATVEQKYYG